MSVPQRRAIIVLKDPERPSSALKATSALRQLMRPHRVQPVGCIGIRQRARVQARMEARHGCPILTALARAARAGLEVALTRLTLCVDMASLEQPTRRALVSLVLCLLS